MKRVIAYTLVVVFASLFALGQTTTDSTKVYFCINRGIFDPSFDNNRAASDSLIAKIRSAVAANTLNHIDIHSFASPDGPLKLNERLAEMRGNTLKNYIIDKTGIDSTYISSISGGIAWDELRNIVAANPGIPSQKEILNILDDRTLQATPKSDVMAKSRGANFLKTNVSKSCNLLIMAKHINGCLKISFPLCAMPPQSQFTKTATAAKTDLRIIRLLIPTLYVSPTR